MTESELPPSLKRLRIDDSDDTKPLTNPDYPLQDTSQWRRDIRYAHRMHLYGCAKKNNAADTPFFAKNKALVYQFLDLSDPIEDSVQVLQSCTLHCGICGEGNWHWIKGGSSRGSTTNMNRHMQLKHSTLWAAAEKADSVALSRAKGEDLRASSNSSILAPNEVGETFVDVLYKKITRWVVLGNHAFTEVENEDFRDILLHIQPALSDHFVQAAAFRDRIFHHAGAQRKWLKSYLASIPGLLAIGCDAWTSSNRIAFLAITASWITEQWELKETLIDFRELQGAHTGQNMAEEVTSVVSELGISDKVLALVSDNASNNGTSKGHIRCLPHIIHLSVMALLLGIHAVPHNTDIRNHIDDDHLFTEEDAEDIVADNDQEAHEDDSNIVIDPMINLQSACEKIRKISRIVRSSPQRMELFKTIATRIEEDKE